MRNIFIAIIISFLSLAANADNHAPQLEDNGKKYELYMNGLPAMCGMSSEVLKYADDHNFVPFSISNGRAGSQPDGEIVFIVTHWVQKEGDAQMITITTLSGMESCIYFVSYNTQLTPNFGNNI